MCVAGKLDSILRKMKLSFLPGDLHLNQERGGMYLVIMHGHEVLR
jgi:hypothetical protein